MSGRSPDYLFLIGAQKSGTTFLADCLDQHPVICVSDPKEPDYFTRNLMRGADWYAARFASASCELLVDASTSYAAAPPDRDVFSEWSADSPTAGVAGRIHSFSPDAKLIYVLREPIGRTWSSYWHAVRAGDESRPFREAISQHDWYLRLSRYTDQIDHYLEVFSSDQLLLLKFDDLVSEPQAVLDRCYDFLGLGRHELATTPHASNQSFQYRGLLAQLNRGVGNTGTGGLTSLAKRLSGIVPRPIKDAVRGLMTKPVPKLSEVDREWLAQLLGPEIERLANEHQIRFS